jgi:hypothetical protein
MAYGTDLVFGGVVLGGLIGILVGVRLRKSNAPQGGPRFGTAFVNAPDHRLRRPRGRPAN